MSAWNQFFNQEKNPKKGEKSTQAWFDMFQVLELGVTSIWINVVFLL